MNVHFIDLAADQNEQSRTLMSLVDAALAAQNDQWCWPPIEGEPDSKALPVDADILADHLSGGDEALLCSLDGLEFVRLVPAQQQLRCWPARPPAMILHLRLPTPQ